MDGVILVAFILGLPANEIVLPIILMAYTGTGILSEAENLLPLRTILLENGWTTMTAISTLIFTLFHWPCSTTLMTVKKETGSLKWVLLSAAIPTVIGVLLCIINRLIHLIL